MKNSKEVIKPRYTNEQLKNFNYQESQLKAKETTRLDKKGNLKLSQKIGLYVGLLGVMSALSGSVSQAKPNVETNPNPNNKTSLVENNIDIESVWEEVLEKMSWKNFQSRAEIAQELKERESIEDSTPIVTPESKTEQIEIATKEPESAKRFFAQVDTLTPTPDPMEKVPSSFSLPFDYLAVNKVAAHLNINLRDLYFPSEEKIKNFNALYSQNELFPIYSNEVMQWEDLIIDLTHKHNINNPQNQISANFIAAIMSIESQGNPNAQSHMGAMGLMQITSPAANTYGFNSQNIFIPENNIQASIKYFADQKDLAVRLGLRENQIWEFAAMQYNGGFNADKFLSTNRVGVFIKNESIVNQIKEADTQEKIRSILIQLYGTDTAPGHEYWTYGPKLTKIETIRYREKILRFVVIAEIAQELKLRGYHNSQIKEFLKTPSYIKRVNAKIRSQIDRRMSYFKQKEVYLENLMSNQSLGDLPNYEDEVNTSIADYLMYR